MATIMDIQENLAALAYAGHGFAIYRQEHVDSPWIWLATLDTMEQAIDWCHENGQYYFPWTRYTIQKK